MRPDDLRELARTDRFYGKALQILVGPGWWMATAMRVASIAYWIAIVLALGWLFAMAIDREPPIEILSRELLTDAVHPGEAIKVRFNVRRDRICRTETTWIFFDGNGEYRRFGPVAIEAGGPVGPDQFTRSWTVPANAAPGAARLRLVSSWECPPNLLHPLYPVTRVSPDLHFEILPKQANPLGPEKGS